MKLFRCLLFGLVSIMFIYWLTTTPKSPLYIQKSSDGQSVLSANKVRHAKSVDYLLRMKTFPPSFGSQGDLSYGQTSMRTRDYYNTASGPNLMDIQMLVITKKRAKTGHQFLHQVLAALHHSCMHAADSRRWKSKADMVLKICENIHIVFTSRADMDPLTASRFQHTVLAVDVEQQRNDSLWSEQEQMKRFRETSEKLHYAAMLKLPCSQQPSILLVLQDDAVAHKHAVEYILSFLHDRFHEYLTSLPLVLVKLYHPDYLLHYFPEIYPMVELLAHVILFALIFRLFCSRLSIAYVVVASLIFVVFMWIIGRPMMIFFRHLHPGLGILRRVDGCCIPAVLYTDKSFRTGLTKWLQAEPWLPVDLSLEAYIRTLKIGSARSYLLEPNLFYHIGFDSSVGHMRDWKLFMSIPSESYLS